MEVLFFATWWNYLLLTSGKWIRKWLQIRTRREIKSFFSACSESVFQADFSKEEEEENEYLSEGNWSLSEEMGPVLGNGPCFGNGALFWKSSPEKPPGPTNIKVLYFDVKLPPTDGGDRVHDGARGGA